ncbi:MIC19/MIC25 domain-containing protein [Chromobacterium vaccinii]|uniref:MIC19/MIC25 domain-containing protein n=1 Tax=Chromobacterium vaccinii TaxID=1108595 RepID=UPI00131A44C7|nr:MIC19/MIC25 domain-containing protein [Chromobacterium vaccinii]
MSKYKIMQFAGKSKGNTPVTSFEDMVKHHPDSGHEENRHYEEIHGKVEEISISSNRKNIKKDFILSDEKNSRNVYVPSPVSGYATYGKNYGTILIYDKEKGKDRVLLAKLHHVKPGTTTFKNGTKVEYGQGLGVQYGTGENGKKEYDVHSHVETDEETYKKYISDIVSGKINLSSPSQEKKTAKKENQAKPQEKPNTPPTPNTQPAKKMGGSLGNLIAKGEGNYGSYNRGNAGDSLGKTIDFSAMSISEVQKRQRLPVGDKNRLFAIGKYQIIPTTMADAVKKLKLTENEKLTPELQEKIFSDYLIAKKRPQVKNFITGKETSPAKAQTALAAEWASVADPKTGLSRYGKVGHNKASISASSTKEALTKMKEEYAVNIKNGMSPEQAWQKVNGLDLIGQAQKNSNDSSQDKEESISSEGKGKQAKQHADAEAAKQKAAEQAKAKQRADAEAAKQKAAEQAKAKQRADAEAAKQKAAEQAKAKQRADAEAAKQKAAEQAKAKQRADAEAVKQKAAEQAKAKQRADAEAVKQKAAEQAKAKQRADAEAVKQKAAEQAKAKQHVDVEAVKQEKAEQAQTKIEAAGKKEPAQPKQQAAAKPAQKQPAQAKPAQPTGPVNLDAQLAQLAALLGQLNAALAPLAKPIQITVDVQNGNIVAAVNAANSQQQRRS